MPSENVKEKVHRDFPKYNADITLRSLVWSAAVTSNAVKPQHGFIAFFYFPTTKVFFIIGPIIYLFHINAAKVPHWVVHALRKQPPVSWLLCHSRPISIRAKNSQPKLTRLTCQKHVLPCRKMEIKKKPACGICFYVKNVSGGFLEHCLV